MSELVAFIVGVIVGGAGAAIWTARLVGKTIRREIDAGVITEAQAEKLTDFHS